MAQTIHDYAPLPDNLTIKKSKLHGLGLFASKAIPANHEFGITHINDKRFPDELIRTPLGGFINHSDSPRANAEFFEDGGFWKLRTVRAIKPGEEITAHYLTYDEAVLKTYN